jgi:quinoprotein glucose dehydrogenase
MTASALGVSRMASVSEVPDKGWETYNGDNHNSHYSPLTQINTKNVARMRTAWRFDAGESGGLQTNPLVVGGTLYAYTTKLQVIALNAESGKLLWKFNPGVESNQPSRGLTLWGKGKQARLFAYVVNYVYALDPATGELIHDFGDHGRIDLRQNLGSADFTSLSVAATTPGVVFRDLLIIGFRTSETKPAARGDVRAYDVRTGKLRWSFHTIPHPGEAGYDTWPAGAWEQAGAANSWAGMALDEARGLLFVPTGSAASDFFGGDRIGDNLYANTLLALDAATGKLRWHFQAVHHDIWDRDFPSPPNLFTMTRNGRKIDAVAQSTKQGFLFILDRTNGKPLFPIEERSFPASDVPGEITSKTQPVETIPAPFARQELTESNLTNRTPEAHARAVQDFRKFKGGRLFVPLSLGRSTIIFPGFDGGAEWGGSAVSPSGVLFLNANDVPWTGALARYSKKGSFGEQVYQDQCAMCHGAERRGNPPEFPSLIGIGTRLSDQAIRDRIHNGAGRMPGFPNITGEKFTDLVAFLEGIAVTPIDVSTMASDNVPDKAAERELSGGSIGDAPFRFTGYQRFTDIDGYPAVEPPWGTLNAIDLNTGKYLWRVPLGQYPKLVHQGIADTGSENYGGPIITAGGVLFVGATIYDRKLRAFDVANGKLLWTADLPFAGVATPATYAVHGKQYIVIATSGSRDRTAHQGAAYVAFALP